MTQPNIVWLNSDHMLWAHHRQQTRHPHLPTYDRLCREGMAFDNAFAVTPLCQPCRASMLTGHYAHRHGMLLNDGQAGSRLEFEPDARLYNAQLQEAGYRTGYFGKWHTGEKRIAQDYGFEGFSCKGYGHPYWHDEYTAYLKEFDLPQPEITVERWVGFPEWSGKTMRLVDFEKPYSSPYFLMEASGTLNSPVETHEAYFLAHLANRWLEDVAAGAQSGDKPFHLRVDPWGPHHPFWVAEPFLNTVDPASLPPSPSFGHELEHRPKNHRDLLAYRKQYSPTPEWSDWQQYLARGHEQATLVDTALGLIVDKLDELGLADNTLLIYSVDHGGALGSNGQLVDKGWLMTDETMRIPLAARWANEISAESRCTKFVMNMDIVPTVWAAANAIQPEICDGRDMGALMRAGDSAEWPDDIMLEHHGHYGEEHFQRMLRYDRFKYVAHLDDLDELYDIEADPFELNNLIDDSAYQAVLSNMRSRLAVWMREHADTALSAEKLLLQMQN